MTEYDFSPEAFQAHLDNMNRVSRWVGRTEEHRSQFGNAAALMEEGANIRQHSPPPEHKTSFGTRRKKIPPPLPLHPFGTPDPMYVPMSAQPGMGMSPYASPLHSADESFIYASGLGSPGPMPPHIPGYPGYATPRSAGVQMMMASPPLMSPPLLSPAHAVLRERDHGLTNNIAEGRIMIMHGLDDFEISFE
ncbi:hypothetical protein H0H93_005005 [Arthromyces matolae]|nr:hypothetical protein H0H93_005005 [Arthromyces matolae]